jgi:hypothetical protein
VSAVLIKGQDVFVQGVISSGATIKYHISLEKDQGDRYIGKRVPSFTLSPLLETNKKKKKRK